MSDSPANRTITFQMFKSSDIASTGALIYGPMFIVGFLAFECLRHSTAFRPTFEVSMKSDVVPSGWFRWIPFVYNISDDELMEKCGLEILMFLRFLRFGKKLACVAILQAILLFPVRTKHNDNMCHDILLLVEPTHSSSRLIDLSMCVCLHAFTYYAAMCVCACVCRSVSTISSIWLL
jgi:hypothetical protein